MSSEQLTEMVILKSFNRWLFSSGSSQLHDLFLTQLHVQKVFDLLVLQNAQRLFFQKLDRVIARKLFNLVYTLCNLTYVLNYLSGCWQNFDSLILKKEVAEELADLVSIFPQHIFEIVDDDEHFAIFQMVCYPFDHLALFNLLFPGQIVAFDLLVNVLKDLLNQLACLVSTTHTHVDDPVIKNVTLS